jgi:hypothetical protein
MLFLTRHRPSSIRIRRMQEPITRILIDLAVLVGLQLKFIHAGVCYPGFHAANPPHETCSLRSLKSEPSFSLHTTADACYCRESLITNPATAFQPCPFQDDSGLLSVPNWEASYPPPPGGSAANCCRWLVFDTQTRQNEVIYSMLGITQS